MPAGIDSSSNPDESESAPADHRRVCHLTDLQNSVVMRRVGRGSKNHTVDSFLRSADALGARVTAKVL